MVPLFLTVSFVGTEAFIQAAGKDAEGTVITQIVPPYSRTDLPSVALYLKAIKQYYPDAQPNFVSLEGFVDAMVLVEGIKRAGKDLTREKLIDVLESIKDLDLGLCQAMRLSYSATDHSGFGAVYATGRLRRRGDRTEELEKSEDQSIAREFCRLAGHRKAAFRLETG